MTGTGTFLSGENYSRPLGLAGLAVANYLLLYVANIAVARHLNPADFDDYSVALSIVTVLSTVSTLGLEKYALRCLPVYRERGDWSHARGFWRFSLRTTAGVSLGLWAGLSLLLEMVLYSRHADSHVAILLLVAFLPAITATLFLVEVATAMGEKIQAVVIYRFLLPASFFVLVSMSRLFELPSSAAIVALCYGLSWLISLSAIGFLVRYAMPVEFWHTEPAYLRKKWLRRGAPFLMNSSMLSLMASSGVIILELLFTSETVVGTFAVVAQTGTFIVLLANTINRFYLPLISLYLERQDKVSMRRMARHRMLVIGMLVMLFLTVVFSVGEDILGWFGPGFREGYPALRVIAVGASINALCSDSPYYLQFMKQERVVFLSTAAGLLINLTATAFLSAHAGALGAAYGYALSMGWVFALQRVRAAQHVSRHLAQDGQP
ncbi:lipopolysaccharide biosynthesis protein [Methylotetracoccus oryzae]|uniref:lipopolysaccharide biosynthesis protein n=1 Tax=Methylotetracoccus oryzae TaxID=1919059 RepID=UPI001117C4F4|nr:oligosaccharide flippase family protein [Methylotetracoccus oryzae]